MRFQTEDENDITWMRDPDGYEVAGTVRKIKDAGRWEQLLAQEADEDGVVDTDALYDFLRHSSDQALLSVGLHDNKGTATVQDVLEAWEEKHKDEGLKIARCDDGSGKPSGLQLYNYGERYGICLEFESEYPSGDIEDVSLDPDEVLDLVNFKANNNADTGAWDCIDLDKAEFEMWRENM